MLSSHKDWGSNEFHPSWSLSNESTFARNRLKTPTAPTCWKVKRQIKCITFWDKPLDVYGLQLSQRCSECSDIGNKKQNERRLDLFLEPSSHFIGQRSLFWSVLKFRCPDRVTTGEGYYIIYGRIPHPRCWHPECFCCFRFESLTNLCICVQTNVYFRKGLMCLNTKNSPNFSSDVLHVIFFC